MDLTSFFRNDDTLVARGFVVVVEGIRTGYCRKAPSQASGIRTGYFRKALSQATGIRTGSSFSRLVLVSQRDCVCFLIESLGGEGMESTRTD